MFENELAALEGLYEGIVALPGTIISAIVACIYLLLYPVVLLVGMGITGLRIFSGRTWPSWGCSTI